MTITQHTAVATIAKGIIDEIKVTTEKPGKGEVLVEVHYASLAPFDTYQADAGYFVQAYPHILSSVGAGKIIQVGEGVEGLAVGDRVTTFGFGEPKNRAIQEYAVVPRTNVAKIPEGISLPSAATIPDNYLTALWTLFGNKGLHLPLPTSWPSTTPPSNASEFVLVYGAASSSGQYATQLLRAAGYASSQIIGVASLKNFELVKSLGAGHVVDYNSPDVAGGILAATGGKKVGTVVNTVSWTSTLDVIAKVVGKESRVSINMPIKNKETGEMLDGVPEDVKAKCEGVEFIGVLTFMYGADPALNTTALSTTLEQVLESGSLVPNRVRLLNRGTFKERVERGLQLLRANQVSGEKVVIELKASACSQQRQ